MIQVTCLIMNSNQKKFLNRLHLTVQSDSSNFKKIIKQQQKDEAKVNLINIITVLFCGLVGNFLKYKINF